MNERIKELLSQAGDHHVILPKGTVYEKFAELIVRDCANWLKQPVNQTPSCGEVMNIAADRLKEHFGFKP